MNSLSWLIYLAGISNSLNGFFLFLTIITCIATIAIIIAVSDDFGIEPKVGAWWRNFLMTTFVVCGIVTSLIPNKETVYAIAASEMGEKVITNPQVLKTTNKAFEALDHWLDDQIKDKKDESSTGSKE